MGPKDGLWRLIEVIEVLLSGPDLDDEVDADELELVLREVSNFEKNEDRLDRRSGLGPMNPDGSAAASSAGGSSMYRALNTGFGDIDTLRVVTRTR